MSLIVWLLIQLLPVFLIKMNLNVLIFTSGIKPANITQQEKCESVFLKTTQGSRVQHVA